MLYIPIALLMFGVLIALHEFGHFAAAKLCGVRVNEFAIGMGPLVFHRQGGETEYSLRLLPIGGFCAMEGEEGQSQDPRAFPNRPWWQRLIILLAGVFMNFLTGFLIILCLFSTAEGFSAPVVGGYAGGDLAQQQGLQVGDRIVKVDGHRIYLAQDISLFLTRGNGSTVELTVLRDGERVEIPDFRLTEMTDGAGNSTILLGIRPGVERKTAVTLVKNTWYQAIDYVRLVWMSLGDLVTGGVRLRDMSGVVEITLMMSEEGAQGAQAAQEAGGLAIVGAMVNILWFVAFISINLSVMNLLPIPALDGGQIFFMAVNGVLLAVRGRELDSKYQNWISAAGFACLMALMLAVTVSDILKRFGV